MRKIVAMLAISATATFAFANPPLSEVEANNVYPGNFIDKAFYPFGAVAVDGRLSPGDVDHFSFSLQQGDYVAVAIYDLTPGDSDFGGINDNDSLLGIFGPGGAFFDSDDDDGPGLLSAHHFVVPATGLWSFAVSGFPDFGFTGQHGQTYDYKFVFAYNPIPEPASLGLLVAGALFALRRR